jgi:hypothetical protein
MSPLFLGKSMREPFQVLYEPAYSCGMSPFFEGCARRY